MLEIMRQIYNGLSILLIGLVGCFVVDAAIGYNIQIHKPLQGGWNSYRFTEFGIQFSPFLLLFFSLIATRLRKSPKWLFFAAMTLLLFSSAFYVIDCVKSALILNAGAWITALVFVGLLAAHLRFISRSESSLRT
jgi:hypothetical protein